MVLCRTRRFFELVEQVIYPACALLGRVNLEGEMWDVSQGYVLEERLAQETLGVREGSQNLPGRGSRQAVFNVNPSATQVGAHHDPCHVDHGIVEPWVSQFCAD
jgi:hypothetical protein